MRKLSTYRTQRRHRGNASAVLIFGFDSAAHSWLRKEQERVGQLVDWRVIRPLTWQEDLAAAPMRKAYRIVQVDGAHEPALIQAREQYELARNARPRRKVRTIVNDSGRVVA